MDKRIRYWWFRVTIPASIFIDKIGSLPSSWRDSPPSEATQTVGSAWAKRMSSAVLRVPSILVPGEYNLLLNPQHPQFKRLKISTAEAFDSENKKGARRRPFLNRLQ